MSVESVSAGASETPAEIGFVLVHGSELGSWLWERLTPLLAHPAVAVDLPGRSSRPAPARSVSIADAIEAIIEDARNCEAERVVLVAHSFSGVLHPPAVDALGDRVAAAVFLGAAVPAEGKSWADLLPRPQRALLRLMYRVRPDGVLSPASQNRKALGNDLDEPTIAWFLERRVPEPPGLLQGVISPAVLPHELPRHYIVLTDDRSTTPDSRDAMIHRLGDVEVHELTTGHLPMLSRPTDLAALLESIAADASDARGLTVGR